MDWSLDSAVQAFSRCREPGIYKQDYLLELYRRYDDPNDVLAAPEKPSWCFGKFSVFKKLFLNYQNFSPVLWSQYFTNS